MSYFPLHRQACAGICPLATTAGAASARRCPNKPARWAVPFGAGAPSDILVRAISEATGRRLAPQMIVDKRSDAGSRFDTERVLRSPLLAAHCR
jgi:tripartite-type tricarboxylate transporter receptor subunit TctC